MFVLLSKILPPLLYPLGLTCLLILLAVFLQQKPRLQRVLLIGTLVMLWLASSRWVSTILVRSLEWRYLPPAELPHAQVIVLLGGGTDSAIYPRSTVEMNGAGDRVFYAAWLYHQGAAPHILATGGRIEWAENTSTPGADEMAEILAMLGVPRENIWLERASLNTADNAAESAKILREKGIQRIILVTSASHMPRSVPLFEHQGLEVIPAPTDYSVTAADWAALTQPSLPTQLLNLFPGVDNLSATTRILKEYLGIFVYNLRGW
jgi:uncharacterized SAM-binding protein YcdF (DUF218 family)